MGSYAVVLTGNRMVHCLVVVSADSKEQAEVKAVSLAHDDERSIEPRQLDWQLTDDAAVTTIEAESAREVA